VVDVSFKQLSEILMERSKAYVTLRTTGLYHVDLLCLYSKIDKSKKASEAADDTQLALSVLHELSTYLLVFIFIILLTNVLIYFYQPVVFVQ